ncbi:sulfatase-like hydrolase/transferase [candidate division KSB1 bacterium]|nr:sulfatase-like hydrolase/transferase [candidate division KSB1 bacterium]
MHNQSRRNFLKSLGMAGAVLPLAARLACRLENHSKPNIIFIMADDLGYADLGCYGSKAIQTPRIDRLAAEGMKFTQFYSGCCVCAPARCTLMTGKHTGHATVRGNTGGIPLPDSEITIAELLRKAGYATGGFGKWGLGDLDTAGVPEKQGFDEFFGYYHQIHAHSYFPEYLIHNGKKVILTGNKEKSGTQFSHHLIVEKMLDFIRRNQERPFFCYAPWTPPHGLWHIPDDEPAWQRYKDESWSHKARVIAAMIYMIDHDVGQVLDLLDELGLADNTLVFFCSDNGADSRFEGSLDSSGILRGKKRDLYEGGIRSPMIVRWHGKIAPGVTSSLPWYFPDVLPTVTELCGAEVSLPEDIDGHSVAPTLLNRGEQKMHEALYWEFPLYDWQQKRYDPNRLMQAARSGDWKLLRHRQDQPWELYHLADDPGETNNLAQIHPQIIGRIVEWISRNRVEQPPQAEPEMPAGRKFR